MMRDAILLAADHIERHPEDFHFSTAEVPTRCGTPGCALGWIGYFAKIPGRSNAVARALQPGLDEMDFYARMNRLNGRWKFQDATWIDSATLCAQALRGYAQKYHSDAEPAR